MEAYQNKQTLWGIYNYQKRPTQQLVNLKKKKNEGKRVESRRLHESIRYQVDGKEKK